MSEPKNKRIKPGSLNEIFAAKGAAKPADGAETRSAPHAPSNQPEAAKMAPETVLEPEQGMATTEDNTATNEITTIETGAFPQSQEHGSGASMLASMLLSLSEPKQEAPIQEAKVPINVKITPETARKLKTLVGYEQQRKMVTVSQQSWIESRLNLIIDYEFRNLPKFNK